MMNWIGRWSVLSVVGFLCLAGPAAAQAPKISAVVDRTQVTIGESLKLEVQISGSGGEVDISRIPHFKVLSRGQSTNVSMINGRIERTETYSFTLIPEREGRLTIPSLPVRASGREYPTKPISVTVKPRSATLENEPHDVFVRAEVQPQPLYDGQPGVYTFRFYQSVQVANARYQAPEFQGFTAEEVDERKNYKTRLNGREFHVTEIRYVLIPVGPGEKRIEPAVLHCDVVGSGRKRRFDPFSMLDEAERRVLTTESVSVTVKPLPPYDGTVPFSGLVGRFNLAASVETSAVRVGDSVTHSLALEGTGNIIDAETPTLSVPDAFKVYADSPESDIQLGPAGYSGTKVFRHALVPTESGTFTLPQVSLVYFDAEAEEYRTRATAPLALRVLPGETPRRANIAPAAPSPGAAPKLQVEFTGRDILPIRESLGVLGGGRRPVSPLAFGTLLGAPAFLVLALGLGMRMRRRDADPVRVMGERSRAALKSAREAGSDADLLAQLHRALASGILARAGRTGASVTTSEARLILREAGLPEETVDEVSELLDRIDAARFGGVGLDEEERKTLPEKTAELLRRLAR